MTIRTRIASAAIPEPDFFFLNLFLVDLDTISGGERFLPV